MRFYSLAIRNLKEVYRDPVSIILGLAMPIVLLILFSSIQQNIRLDIFSPQYLTPGIIIFCFAFLIMFAASLIAKDRESAFLVRLFTTPLKPTDYILAYLLPFIPIAFCQAVICLITGTFLGGGFAQVTGATLVFLLFSITCISLGMLLGALFTVNQVSGVGSLLVTAIGLFSGVWMDLHMIGGVFETIGFALPFAHAVEASKALLAGTDYAGLAKSIWIVAAYTLIFFAMAVVAFRWRMRQG